MHKITVRYRSKESGSVVIRVMRLMGYGKLSKAVRFQMARDMVKADALSVVEAWNESRDYVSRTGKR
jgi:hypothetical protein